MKKFELTEIEVLQQVIREQPLATIVGGGPLGLAAHHVPLILRGGSLVGHVARANPLAQRNDTQVLAIFQAADGYVSPSWYPGKAEHGKVVPTWNYVVAHAHGRLRVIDDPAWILAQLEALTDHQEAQRAHPWKVGDAPPEFTDKLLHAIVGIEIAVARLEGVRKASQNRDARDQAAVKLGLSGEGRASASMMARWM